MRCDAIQYVALRCYGIGCDFNWKGWDGFGMDQMGFGFGFGNWPRKDGVGFGLKVFKYGWDEVGDSWSWVTNIERLLLMIRIAQLARRPRRWRGDPLLARRPRQWRGDPLLARRLRLAFIMIILSSFIIHNRSSFIIDHSSFIIHHHQ